MKKTTVKPDSKLNAEEQELLNAFEVGEIENTPPLNANLEKFKLAAAATILKERLIEKNLI